MTPKERFIAALTRKEVDRPAVGCVTQSATFDQMNAVGATWPESHSDANKMALLGAAAAEVIGFENMRIPFCLTVEAEAFGATVDLGKGGSTPSVKQALYDLEDTPSYPEDFLQKGRAKVVLDAVKILKEKYGDKFPIVVGTTGPLTIAGHLVGVENLLLGMITDPDSVHKFIKATAQLETEYLKALVAAGADVINMSDPSSSTDMLSGEMFDEFSQPYTKLALEGAAGAIKVLHICGNTTTLLDRMIATGTDAISIEEKVNPAKAAEIVNGRVALVGNVGVVKPLLQGTPDDCYKTAKEVIAAGFNVIAPGCGLAASVVKDNLDAMVKAVKG